MGNNNMLRLAVAATSLLVGNEAEAFVAPPPPLAAPEPSRSNADGLLRRSASRADADDASASPPSFDYDALARSDVEKNRLTSMYSRFGSEEWLVHRASDRFYRTLFDANESPIVGSLLDEAFVLVAFSLGIILWNELVVDGFTGVNGAHHDPLPALAGSLPNIRLSLPMDPFLLCGGPLGLLLVFRNDASFGRYNEAFHHWEKIVSNFQNMLLMASTAAPDQRDALRDLGLASWALVRTLRHEVSGEFLDPRRTYEDDVRRNLPSGERADALLGARNKLFRAQRDVHAAIEPLTDHITVLDKRTLINTVNDVALQCVECERLYTTPIPLLYTRHALAFLTVWMTLMPLGLYDVFASSWNHLALLPAMALLTFLFFGIEEIAVSLEEPFSILPLEELVEDVWVSMEDVLEWNGEEGAGPIGVGDGEAATAAAEKSPAPPL